MLIGGALAAALGFAVSELDLLELRGDNSELRDQLAQQQEQIATLQQAQSEAAAPIDMPDLSGVEADMAALNGALGDIQSRLADLEARPADAAAPQGDFSALENDLAALRQELDSQRDEIAGLRENAMSVEEATAAAARTAQVQSLLSRLTTALAEGKPLAPLLAELRDAGVNDIPAALTDIADTGPVTLANLQSRFPEAARDALASARADASSEPGGGVAGFLRRQLGARSVAPREGNDPDAVLSRAEAAVRDARLGDALAEIETLPVVAQEAMQSWLDDARARLSALTAAEDLTQRLMAN
ncbi:COG4223 family protein [Sulfitobacter aestuarii]|uniref:COG4223 family protein n=1 Tax=Sulfitobacter aestuarii TaxID=2161676 RepID=A0ABW5U6V1_9RHOB